MGRYILAWFPMVVIAIANGVLRDAGYGRHMRELRAHQLSTLSGVLLFGIYIGAVMRFLPPASAGQAVAIGLVWLLMTLLFEFGFGHYVAGHSWRKLCQDFNMSKGRVWPVILVWVAVAPYLFFRIG
jgi:hypothetical protein